MKTFLAVLAAGLIGGGVAIGAVALNLVPTQTKPNEISAKVGPLELEETPAPTSNAEYEQRIQDLTHKVEALEVQLSKQDQTVSRPEYDALKLELANLKKAPAPVSVETSDETIEGAVTAVTPTDPEFEAAVRSVYDKIEAERVEERRTERQAQRLDQLEQAKQRISDFVPKLVTARATSLNIPEASIPDVSAALVTHAQSRAEIASEAEGQRIDGEDVDKDAQKQKLDNLEQTTIAALTSFVDEETAKQLISAIDRTGRDNGNNNQRRRGTR